MKKLELIIDAVMALYNNGTKVSEIVNQAKISKNDFYSALMLAEKQGKQVSWRHKKETNLPMDDAVKMYNLNNGSGREYTVKQISEKLGISESSVYKSLNLADSLGTKVDWRGATLFKKKDDYVLNVKPENLAMNPTNIKTLSVDDVSRPDLNPIHLSDDGRANKTPIFSILNGALIKAAAGFALATLGLYASLNPQNGAKSLASNPVEQKCGQSSLIFMDAADAITRKLELVQNGQPPLTIIDAADAITGKLILDGQYKTKTNLVNVQKEATNSVPSNKSGSNAIKSLDDIARENIEKFEESQKPKFETGEQNRKNIEGLAENFAGGTVLFGDVSGYTFSSFARLFYTHTNDVKKILDFSFKFENDDTKLHGNDGKVSELSRNIGGARGDFYYGKENPDSKWSLFDSHVTLNVKPYETSLKTETKTYDSNGKIIIPGISIGAKRQPDIDNAHSFTYGSIGLERVINTGNSEIINNVVNDVITKTELDSTIFTSYLNFSDKVTLKNHLVISDNGDLGMINVLGVPFSVSYGDNRAITVSPRAELFNNIYSTENFNWGTSAEIQLKNTKTGVVEGRIEGRFVNNHGWNVSVEIPLTKMPEYKISTLNLILGVGERQYSGYKGATYFEFGAKAKF